MRARSEPGVVLVRRSAGSPHQIRGNWLVLGILIPFSRLRIFLGHRRCLRGDLIASSARSRIFVILELRGSIKTEVALPFLFRDFEPCRPVLVSIETFAVGSARRLCTRKVFPRRQPVSATRALNIGRLHAAGPPLAPPHSSPRPSWRNDCSIAPPSPSLPTPDGIGLPLRTATRGPWWFCGKAEPTTDGSLRRLSRQRHRSRRWALPRAIAVAILERIGLVVKGDV